MKKKIYFFSEKLSSSFSGDLEFVNESFEIVPFQNFTAEETLQKKFDFIELSEGDYENFKPLLKAVSWKTSHVGVADLLLFENGHYKPINLFADCIFKTLKMKTFSLNTSQSAMIVGSYDFVLSVAVKAALSGYSELIISLFESSRILVLETKIKEFIFNLKLTFVKMNEITQIQTASGLLVSNISKSMDQDAFESLTYFNFLSRNAVFVDCQSYRDASLIEEAKRAELNVVEEVEILTLKYKSMSEFSKISSLV